MVSGQGNSLLKSKVLLNTSYRAPSCVFWLALLRLMSIIPLRISWDITLVSLPLPWSLEDTPFLKSLQKEGLSESTSSSAWWRPHLCRVRHSHRVALGGPEGRGGEGSTPRQLPLSPVAGTHGLAPDCLKLPHLWRASLEDLFGSCDLQDLEGNPLRETMPTQKLDLETCASILRPFLWKDTIRNDSL